MTGAQFSVDERVFMVESVQKQLVSGTNQIFSKAVIAKSEDGAEKH